MYDLSEYICTLFFKIYHKQSFFFPAVRKQLFTENLAPTEDFIGTAFVWRIRTKPVHRLTKTIVFLAL